ncbi:FHA domain-containing protein [Ectothiorhodospiraceae bacterium WFHF3C12]|nr:FHA domain-containing protein [Ectothiorhodospiraceae bacterium WFHF3C12]
MAKLLHLVDGVVTNEFELAGEGLTIGRSSHSAVQIDDISVSANHARVVPDGSGGFMVEDLDSTNGTYINDERIERHALRSDDHLRVGWTVFKFVERTESELEKTARVKKTWIPGVYVTRK